MFNLIVKDPTGDPPERAVLDRGPDPKIRVPSNLLRTELNLASDFRLPHRFVRLATSPILPDFHLAVKLFF